MTRTVRVMAAVTLLCGLSELGVSAWGDEGHKIVCAIAYKLLSSNDRAEVDRLTHLFRTPADGKYSFFTAGCVFADMARSKARDGVQGWTRFAEFESWHFLNLPRTAKVVGSDACGGDCVLEGIQHHFDRLRNHGLGDQPRAEALLFLAHWIGDVHQPLHVSFKDDLGGNRIKPISGGFYPSDHLHAVWDSGLIAKARGPSVDWWSFAGTLRSGITPAMRKEWAALEPRAWAQESYDLTLLDDVRYCQRANNSCAAIPGGRSLTSTYQVKFGETVELRLQKAGVRLAAFITRALHP